MGRREKAEKWQVRHERKIDGSPFISFQFFFAFCCFSLSCFVFLCHFLFSFLCMFLLLLLLCSSKVYGPKGVGAVYIRRRPRVRLQPLISGGGQERGFRSGTLPAPLVIGFGEASRICKEEMEVSMPDCFYETHIPPLFSFCSLNFSLWFVKCVLFSLIVSSLSLFSSFFVFPLPSFSPFRFVFCLSFPVAFAS